MKFYNIEKKEVLEGLDVQEEKGLSSSEVKKRREKYGLNEFTPKEEGSFWEELKGNLTEPMILILLGAAVISAFVGEVHDAFGILGAVTIGLSIG